MPMVPSLNPPLRDLDDRYREFLSILTDANKIGWRELKHIAALVTAGWYQNSFKLMRFRWLEQKDDGA